MNNPFCIFYSKDNTSVVRVKVPIYDYRDGEVKTLQIPVGLYDKISAFAKAEKVLASKLPNQLVRWFNRLIGRHAPIDNLTVYRNPFFYEQCRYCDKLIEMNGIGGWKLVSEEELANRRR